MEEIFKPDTEKQSEANENQKQHSEKQIQALRDSTQAIENHTRVIQQSSDILNNKIYKNLLKEEHKKTLKCRIAIINYSLSLLILTKLILQLLRQFPICLMTKTKANSVWNLLKELHISLQLTTLIRN